MLDSGASFVQFAMTHSLFDDLVAPFLFVGLTLALALAGLGAALFVVGAVGASFVYDLARSWGLGGLLGE